MNLKRFKRFFNLTVNMSFKNYYAFDLIENSEGEFKIVDAHGITDSVGFSERAGYKPRFDRIYRYMDILKGMRRGGERILFLYSKENNSKIFKLPKSLQEYYNKLPKGVAHLKWIDDSLKREKLERKQYSRNLRKGKKNAFMKELDYLKKAARRSEVDFDYGKFEAYAEDKILYTYVDYSNLKGTCFKADNRAVSFDEIGLVVNWGDNTLVHPSSKEYWYGKKSDIPFNFINDANIAELFTLTNPKTVFPFFVMANCGNYFEKLFPEQIYLGMGMSTYESLKEFKDNLEESENGKVAVKKPLCTHRGIDISFLSKKNLDKIVLNEKKIAGEMPRLRKKFRYKLHTGFRFTAEDEQNDAFRPVLAYKNNGNRIYPFVEMGSYILQEYVEPKPVISKKTGKFHQGPIRVQLLNNQLITAMYRFPKKPYVKGEFVDLTAKNNPTFFERTDEELEERIEHELKPFLSSLEKSLEKSEISPTILNFCVIDHILNGKMD